MKKESDRLVRMQIQEQTIKQNEDDDYYRRENPKGEKAKSSIPGV